MGEYALKGRYPLDFVDVQPGEYEEAVVLAEKAVRWAEKVLGEEGPEAPMLREAKAPYRVKRHGKNARAKKRGKGA